MKPIKSTAIILLMLLSPVAMAEEDVLNDAGITPDSALYALDRLFERAGLFLSFNDEAKAEKLLQIASERLAESIVLLEKGKTEYSLKLSGDYYRSIKSAYELADSDKLSETERANLKVQIKIKTKKHISILDNLSVAVPEGARKNFLSTAEDSNKGFKKTDKNDSSFLGELAEGYLKSTEEKVKKARGKSDDVLESMSDRMAGKVKEEIGVENKSKK